MSESTTPRTDAAEVFRPNHEGQGVGWVKSKFARTLETELQQAQREVERLGNDLFEKQSVITELAGRAFTTAQECGLLKQEVEELKRDKERLDWLQMNHKPVEMLAGHFRIQTKLPYPDNDIRSESLRQAIDNAMKEEK